MNARQTPPGAVATDDDARMERQIVRQVLAGDAAAYEQLLTEHQTRVFSLALRMLGQEQEAQDATQDAFVQAYLKLATFNPEWRFKTWLMTIASNLCIDRLRRRRIEPSAFSEHATDDDPEPMERIASKSPTPEAEALRHERLESVIAMVNQLPPEDRSMVAMYYWGDLSYDEIALAHRTTVSAVKSRLFRAKRAMAASEIAARMA